MEKSFFETTYKWHENGSLSYDSSSSVLDYYDTGLYENVDFESLEDDSEYALLYDRFVEKAMDSLNISDESTKLLKSLNESEKREAYLTIIKYSKPEDIDVLLSLPLIREKVLFAVLTLLYCLFVIFRYYGRKEKFYLHDFNVEDSYVYQSVETRCPGNLFYESIKVKEAYLAAERKRILNLWNEIKKNVKEDDRTKMLTKYEKKLIKKS